MSTSIYITEAEDPPCGLAISLSPGGGGSAATLSFLLVAWDDPDEKDISLARFSKSLEEAQTNNPDSVWGGTTQTFISRISKSIELNDIATISWTAPRRKPHHYALYYQAAASYDLTKVGIKILPSGSMVNGNIPGYATSLALPARAAAATYYTARTHTWIAPCAIDTVNHYIDLRGNWMGYFENGTSSIYEAQTVTTRLVTAKALYFDRGGEYTRLTLSAGPTAGITYASIVVPSSGLFCPWDSGGGVGIEQIILSPTQDIEHQPRDLSVLDLNGLPVARSFTQDNLDEAMIIRAPYTSVVVKPSAQTSAISGGAIYWLHKWRRWRRPVEVRVYESDTTIVHGTDRWRGVIADVNEYQIPGAQDKDEVQVTFRAHKFRPSYYDFGGWPVIAVTAGAATCVINGPYDPRLVAGARVWIAKSTGNDGLYVISSVSTGTNQHTLTFTTNLASSTDDGFVLLEDML